MSSSLQPTPAGPARAGAIVTPTSSTASTVDQRVHDDDLELAAGRGDRRPTSARSARRPAPPVRRVELLRPRELSSSRRDGRHVVDLGQNVNGWVRVADLGPDGTELTLMHGESLDAAATSPRTTYIGRLDVRTQPQLTRRSDRPRRVRRSRRRRSNRGTRPTGSSSCASRVIPGRSTADDVTGRGRAHRPAPHRVVRAAATSGSNRLHDAADWSFRDNACDIPTDCPQRERAGWTGDWQLFVADRGVPLRRRRVLHQVAARPRRRPTRRRRGPQLRARSHAARRPDDAVGTFLRRRRGGATPS